MKLILDSETLNANCKMTDLQEEFLEKPLSNSPADVVKNGDIYNGSAKVNEEENGIVIEKNGNSEADKIVEESVDINDEVKIQTSVTDNTSEEKPEESNDVSMEDESKKDTSHSPVKDIVASVNEVPQSINEEEAVKTPNSQDDTLQENGTSEAQETLNEVSKESTEIKEDSTINCEIISEIGQCGSEIKGDLILKEAPISTTGEEKIQSKEPIKIDELIKIEETLIEKESETTEIGDTIIEKQPESNIDKEPEVMEIDETIIEKEHVPIITDETIIEKEHVPVTIDEKNIEKEPEAMKIDEPMDEESPVPVKICETIVKESEAMKLDEAIIEKASEAMIIDETITEKEAEPIIEKESEDMTIDETIVEKEPGAVKSDGIIIEKEPEPIKIDEAINKSEAESMKIIEIIVEKDLGAVGSDGTIIGKELEPINIDEATNRAKAESIKIDETILEKEPGAMKSYGTIIEKEPEPVKIDESINEPEAETTNAKESEVVKTDEKNIETDLEPPNNDKIIEAAEIIKKNETILCTGNGVPTSDETDSTHDDVTVNKPESAEPVSATNDSIINDEVKKCEETETAAEVKETYMKMDADAKKPSDIANNTSDDVIETAKPADTIAEVTTDTIPEKTGESVNLDSTEKVIDLDTSDKDTGIQKNNVVDMVDNSEDSSDGCTIVEGKDKDCSDCTIVETNHKAASPDSQAMEVDKPSALTDNDSKKSSTDVASDAPQTAEAVPKPKTISGLSNTLDIISDDEEETPAKVVPESVKDNAKEELSSTVDNKCINLDDDDDILLIDEDVSKKDSNEQTEKVEEKPVEKIEIKDTTDGLIVNEGNKAASKLEELLSSGTLDEPKTENVTPEIEIEKPDINEKTPEKSKIKSVPDSKPLVPANFLKTFKSNVAQMTRDELEELCLVKIVEGIVEKSNLSEIKVKLKTMNQNIDEWRKKAMMLSKQNRDLQIVLKTVQEEQRKRPDLPITPLKITRSVGMQVFMTESNERGVTVGKRPRPGTLPSGPKPKGPIPITNFNPRLPGPSKINNNAPIPVPRLVPATINGTSPAKPRVSHLVQSSAISSNTGKSSPVNNIKPAPVKSAEKRPLSSGSSSFTVDLTDDEPPTKQMPPRQAPVRLVSQQHLMGPRAQNNNVNSPRKVYIPINSQNQMRPGNAVILKSVAPAGAPGPRQRPPMVRLPNNSTNSGVRPALRVPGRHPAPLPDVAKQQQPPNWKNLPPSPDLKISKVENGIVISWKIDGYVEDSYEEIASYQLYAYQETSSPPSTLLWKKIGDVKALPLPMACTLTQFMAGYKYYFAVRAVDIKSRIGPFSLPGSILLLNK